MSHDPNVGDPSQAYKQDRGSRRQRPLISRGGRSKLHQPATAMHPHGSGKQLSESGQNGWLRVADRSATRGATTAGGPRAVGIAAAGRGLPQGDSVSLLNRQVAHPFATCTSSRAALTPARAQVGSTSSNPTGCSLSPFHAAGAGPLRMVVSGTLGYFELEPDAGRHQGPASQRTDHGSQAGALFVRSQHRLAARELVALPVWQKTAAGDRPSPAPLRMDFGKEGIQDSLMDLQSVNVLPIPAFLRPQGKELRLRADSMGQRPNSGLLGVFKHSTFQLRIGRFTHCFKPIPQKRMGFLD